jgi:hypothetical protein
MALIVRFVVCLFVTARGGLGAHGVFLYSSFSSRSRTWSFSILTLITRAGKFISGIGSEEAVFA